MEKDLHFSSDILKVFFFGGVGGCGSLLLICGKFQGHSKIFLIAISAIMKSLLLGSVHVLEFVVGNSCIMGGGAEQFSYMSKQTSGCIVFCLWSDQSEFLAYFYGFSLWSVPVLIC